MTTRHISADMAAPPGAQWQAATLSHQRIPPEWWDPHADDPGQPEGDQPLAASYGLTPQRESVQQARRLTTQTLHGWGLDEVCDDVVLVVSELVTNALRHGMPADAATPGQGHDRVVDAYCLRLSLFRKGAHVMCAVQDATSDLPHRGDPGPLAAGGRGLHIVESFSSVWGWLPVEEHGKIVWAMFQTAPADPAA